MSDRESLSSSSASGEEGEWLDVDAEEDGQGAPVVSLLDDRVFPDAMSMLSYCKEKHQLDFLAIRDRLNLDIYGTIRLINFIRGRVAAGVPPTQDIVAADFASEEYLKPVLDDDGLIQSLDDLPRPRLAAQPASPAAGEEAGAAGRLLARNAELEAELEQLARQFEKYRLAVEQTLDERWAGEDGPDQASQPRPSEKAPRVDDSAHYFQSYAHSDIHETMLKDTVRTDAYRDFIYGNKHLFAGKVVLDIGCGTGSMWLHPCTGILSMFCAKAGAKRVIAVDKSAIIDKARENIFHNGLDGQITCLRGMVEDVTLPVDTVDVIVSEWMGYGLLYEAMLPSVIWARDRYLRPDGLLVPSHASLWIAPVSDPEFVADHISFWRDVYGFDMKAMLTGVYDDVCIHTAPSGALCGDPCMFRLFDLHTVRKEELAFTAQWHSSLSPGAALDGFLVWFDMYFAASRTEQLAPANSSAEEWARPGTGRVAFTTGPLGKETHWKQGLLLGRWHLGKDELGQLASLAGEISYSTPDDDARALTLRVEWTGPSGRKLAQSWALM